MEQPESYMDNRGDKCWYLPSKGREYYHRLDGPAIEQRNGSKHWFVNNIRHREDGPAIEYTNGTKEWWVNGSIHRIDCQLCSCSRVDGRCVCDGHIHSNGPAYEDVNGSKEWWVNGQQHRMDGPAIEENNRTKEWWINDKRLPTKEVEAWIKEHKVDLKTEAGQLAFKLRWS